jgi:hypothetical protein
MSGCLIHIGILVSREAVNLNLVPESPAATKLIGLPIARARKQIARQRDKPHLEREDRVSRASGCLRAFERAALGCADSVLAEGRAATGSLEV